MAAQQPFAHVLGCSKGIFYRVTLTWRLCRCLCSLEDLAKDPALDPDRLLRLFCQASAGLRHLHDDLRVLHK